MNFNLIVNILYVVFATMFGTIIGSFMNVVIYRIPEGRTVVKGHSMCMTCGHELGALDLVPVFSWLFLGGKCRYCKAPISSRYIKIETFTGLSFMIYALTHISFFPDPLDPTSKLSIILFTYICVTLVLIAVLVSSMMIYHDVGKSYYGYTIVSFVGALIITLVFLLSGNPLLHFEYLGLGAGTAVGVVAVFALVSTIIKKKYTKTDFWLDLPYVFFYTFFGKSIVPFKWTFAFLVPLWFIPRLIVKNGKHDKFSSIISQIGLLVFMIVGYIINKYFLA